MAVGMTLVILTSGIDLSVAHYSALTGAVAASMVGADVNALVAVVGVLALEPRYWVALQVSLSLKVKVQAFIATLR